MENTTAETLLLFQIRNLGKIIVLQQTALTDINCRFNMLCKAAIAIEISDFPEPEKSS